MITASLCLLVKPAGQIKWILDVFTGPPAVYVVLSEDSRSCRDTFDDRFRTISKGYSFNWKPMLKPELSQIMKVGDEGFLSPAVAKVFCNAHDRPIWEDRSKRRKVYERISIDPRTSIESAWALENLANHIALSYHDVDYFVIAESNDILELNVAKSFWLGPNDSDGQSWTGFWAALRPYRDKIIYHAIQPKSDPSTVIYSYGDHIAVHYIARHENGTVIGSSLDHRPWPAAFILGRSDLKGWNSCLQDMCIGEKRTITLPPEMAYGPNGSGPIPGNSTLTFETELVGIKGVEETWQDYWDLHLTNDPLIYERRVFITNAAYSQIIPYLSGKQAIEQGDVIIVGEPDQMAAASTIAVLRNCDFPRIFHVTSSEEGSIWRGMSQQTTSRHQAVYFDRNSTILPQVLREENYYTTDTNDAGFAMVRTVYCGPCYGAKPRSNARFAGCCNSCEEVKDAYEALPWAVGSAYEHIEQCIRDLKPYNGRICFD